MREDRAIRHAQAIDPNDAAFRIDNGQRIVLGAHPAGAAGVVGTFQMFTQEGVDLRIGLNLFTRLDFRTAELVEGFLAENLAREAHAMAEFLPVFCMAHIVETDHRVVLRIGRSKLNVAAGFRQVVADMHLEAMALSGSLAVVGNGDGEEMKLDIRLLQSWCGAQEGAGLELVGGTKPALGHQPLRTRHALPEPW